MNEIEQLVAQPVISSPPLQIREELLDRRRRLTAVPQLDQRPDLAVLLRQVDEALARVGTDAYGLCLVCHDPVEADRLRADPLVRVCLGCLSDEQSRALEHDLETAAGIQAALLPERSGRLDGWEFYYHYRPLGPVSGDHVDLVRPDPAGDGVYFLFGDVSGKGIAASILMSNLHALFRSLITVGLPLAELVGRINRLFCQSTADNVFATLVAGRLDDSGSAEICNAGHLPPLLARNGEVIPLTSNGLPVGMFANVDFSVERLELAADDLLLLYTDGLSEATGTNGEEYGIERLSRHLTGQRNSGAEETVKRCLVDLESFLGGAALEDDLTVMALERRP